jgi:hypothetical protein
MDPRDLHVRNTTYRLFIEAGHAPTVDEVAAAAGRGSDEVAGAWGRLHDAHDPVRIEVRDRRPDQEDILFHCLVPARCWWDDIAFT